MRARWLGLAVGCGFAIAAGPGRAAPDRARDAAATTAPRATGPGPADLAALRSGEPRDVERAVAAITASAAADPDALFAAARACEDELHDPARAAAIYDRIVAEYPDARASIAAARRARALHATLGRHGETAAQAAELAQLIAGADAAPVAQVIERADRLASAAWPGAPDAALWLAEWLRRTGRLAEAQVRYAAVVARWPGQPQAIAALRGGAGCALEAHDASLAESLASRLPVADPGSQIERDDLLAAAARSRRRARGYLAAWLAIAAVLAALIGSLVEVTLRSAPGTRWSALRPPGELVFGGPVAAVLIGVAFTAHRLIAPAVATIAIGGLAFTWLSGAALDRLRALGRPRRLRSLGHVAACLIGVAGLGYIALTRGDLLDLLIETVRVGPEP